MRLRLFGQLQFQDGAGHSLLPRSRKAQAVLAILAMAGGKPVLRSRLTGLLWSRREKEQAQASLRQCVHELRHSLGNMAGDLLQAARNHLTLQADLLWVDANVFLNLSADRPDGLELFQTTLLDDLTGVDPAFDQWLDEKREQMTQHARALADRLAAAQSENEPRIGPPSPFAIVSRYSTTANSPQRDGPEGIRLAVVPPRALDGNQQDALSLGLAEELITALSRFRWISCVASTWLPVGEPPTGPAWRRLSLDFLLDGTIQRAGNRVRVICRLLDMRAGGKIVWARRFDRELGDVLTLQDEIAAETAAQIDPQLLLQEGERMLLRGSSDPTSYDLLLRAIPAIYRLEPTGFREAGDTLAAALAMDPGNAAAHAWWAYWHLFLVGQGWAPDPTAATLRAASLAERAVTLDPGDARALTLVGHVRGFLHKRTEEARALHERALSLNPNLPLAWCFAGFANCYLGQHKEAIQQIGHAQHLSPHDPHGFFFDMALMMPHFLLGEFDTVVTIGRRAIELNPSCSSTYKGYLAALGHLRRDREAATVLLRLLSLEPGFSVRSAIERSPMRRAEDLALYAEGLRRAGLREG